MVFKPAILKDMVHLDERFEWLLLTAQNPEGFWQLPARHLHQGTAFTSRWSVLLIKLGRGCIRCLLVVFENFNFWGFCSLHNVEPKVVACMRGQEDS